MSFLDDQNMNRGRTSSQIDYVRLYENIGDIVIERAYAGDKQCLAIYECSYQRLIKERNAGFLDNQTSKPAGAADIGDVHVNKR